MDENQTNPGTDTEPQAPTPPTQPTPQQPAQPQAPIAPSIVESQIQQHIQPQAPTPPTQPIPQQDTINNPNTNKKTPLKIISAAIVILLVVIFVWVKFINTSNNIEELFPVFDSDKYEFVLETKVDYTDSLELGKLTVSRYFKNKTSTKDPEALENEIIEEILSLGYDFTNIMKIYHKDDLQKGKTTRLYPEAHFDINGEVVRLHLKETTVSILFDWEGCDCEFALQYQE